MSSARNHAKRSHRSHHDMKVNTGHSTRRAIVRRAIVRSYTKPRRESSFFARLLSKMTHKGREESRG